MAFNLLRLALAASYLLLPSARALNSIEIKAQDFSDPTTGNRFEIFGIAYQPGGSSGFDPSSGIDPLSNPELCVRDAALMQQLGFNVIRVYNLDPAANHDQCASIFNMAGIYMIIDVNSPLPGQSIAQLDPSSSYDKSYLQRVFQVVDGFRGYPNTLGFFSANELINDDNTGMIDPPYVRAVTRDIKQYLKARGGRQVPVGYSATDFRPTLIDMSNYVQCTLSGESDNESRSDFFGINSYSWCGPSATFVSSTYNQLAADFAGTTIPVFFSEYGCNQPSPRAFNEVLALYGSNMTTFSGGVVYEWTEEPNMFGLVQIQSSGNVQILRDFDTLLMQYQKLNFTLIMSQNTTATSLTPPTCGANLITQSGFTKSFKIPAQPPGASDLINNGAGGQQTGSIVSVTQTTASLTVTMYNGQTSSGLTVTSVTAGNAPTAGLSGSGTATSHGAAPRITGVMEGAVIGAVGAAMLALA